MCNALPRVMSSAPDPEYKYFKGKGWVLIIPNRLQARGGGFLTMEHRTPSPGEHYLRLSKVYDKNYLESNYEPKWDMIKAGYEGYGITDFDKASAGEILNTGRYTYITISQ